MKVLYLIVPASGHINGSSHFSELLQKEGVTQGFLVLHPDKVEIKKRFYINSSTTTLFYKNIFDKRMVGGQLFYRLNYILNWILQENYKSLKRRIALIEIAINNFQPDIFIVDSFFSFVYFMLPSFQKKIILINTQLNSYRDRDVPPLSTTLAPSDNNFEIKKKILWKLNNFYRKIIPIRALWQDPWSLTKKYAIEKGIPYTDVVLTDKCFQPGIKGVPELIAGYKSFDLPRNECIIPQVYLAMQVNTNRQLSDEGQEILKFVRELRKKTQGKLIYCSLGTLSMAHNRNCYKFLLKLLQILKDRSEWKLILSLRGVPKKELGEISGNVRVFDNVPQLEILPFFDMMITHAGPNSIFECIYSEVPMLAFPLSYMWDQGGNAARVAYHKIGLLGDINRVERRQLEKLILTILETHSFKENIKEMKKRCIAEYQPKKILDFIHQFSAISRL